MTSPPFPPGTRLAAYLRDSGGNEQDLSLERQRLEISAWAAANELIITSSDWFEDAARSGTTTAGRDRFLDMIATIQKPIAGVVTWEFARLSRQYDDILYHVADLRRRGFAVHSIVDNIPDTLEGRLFESFLAYKSAKYSQDLGKAVKSGFRRSIEVGHTYPNRMAPVGYKKEFCQVGTYRDGRPRLAGRLVPDPDTAPLVQAVFEARANGRTYNEIHHDFPIVTHSVSLHRILLNPIYTGILHFGGQDYPGFCDPLVSAETWTAAQAVNQRRAGRFGYDHPRALRSGFALTGLLFCSHCGAPMNGRSAPDRKVDLYVCREARVGLHATCHAPGIPRAELEQLVFRAVADTALNPILLAPLLQEAEVNLQERSETHQSQVKRLRRGLQETSRQVRLIMAAICDAGHSRLLLDELQRLEAAQSGQQLALANAEASSPAATAITPGELEKALAVLKDKLRGTPADRATVLRGIVVEVRAERIGGSPIRHRKGAIVGTVQLRLPLLDDEHIANITLGE
ncbi:recombinase family protein [bacterium]|nr:MAG: recombinase family protein [bacterium]